ncbi:MAG: hypothetical protein AB7T63_04925 [Planctomycetota bacterium]
MGWRSSCSAWAAGAVRVLVLALPLSLGGAGREATASEPEGPPWVGLVGLDPLDPGHRRAARVAPLAGLGRLGVITAPVPWARLEPEPPREGVRRYRFEELDDAFLTWQLAGLDPVLVLTPENPWAGVAREESAWARTLHQELPAAEVAMALREAVGATPPRSDQWSAWARFVRTVVERYDGDGVDDMPGLRRPVRHVQVLDRADLPTSWLGSADQYMRLLHAAGIAAHEAHSSVRVVAATIDVLGLGHAPHPDVAEWRRRAEASWPVAPRQARLVAERAHDLLAKLLDLPRIYDVLPQRGAAHLEDDVANVRYLRRRLDEGGATNAAVWLVGGPEEKLGEPRVPVGTSPDPVERNRRRLLVRAARDPRHGDHAAALAWLRRGQAYDLVRTVLRSRAAGADAVYVASALDASDAQAAAHATGCPRRGVVEPEGDGGARTPMWYALRQLVRHLEGHRSVREQPAAGAAHLVLLTYPSAPERAWCGVLLADADADWAGDGAPGTAPGVAVTLPDGRYRIETTALADEAPWGNDVRSRQQTLTLPLSAAPLWILPIEVESNPR